ncbi:hypothetical protein A2U01_0034823, partial [Trifolium medium]|nr:hypothetical protein [Trifolium medium]
MAGKWAGEAVKIMAKKSLEVVAELTVKDGKKMLDKWEEEKKEEASSSG